MKRSDLKIGIVGCGHIGKRHAEHINQQAHLEAICDIHSDRLNELAKIYGCRAYSSIDQLLVSESQLDVVAICTPNGNHAEHTIKALQANKHVICEKPMAISVQECVRMIEEEKAANKKLFIVKQNRFNPPIVAVKKAIVHGYLGRILSFQLNCFWNRNEQYYRLSDWKGTKDLDGGILFTQYSHFVDIMYWLIGDMQECHSIATNFIHKDLIEFEDTGVVIVQMKSGALGTINFTINSYAKNFEGSLTLFGEKGTVKIGGQYLNVLEYQEIDGYQIPVDHEVRHENNYGYYKGSMSNHDKVYENVIDVLQHNGIIATSSLEGLKTVEIIENIYNKMKVY